MRSVLHIRVYWRSAIAAVAVWASAWATTSLAQSNSDLGQRLVKSFDFDERQRGNLDTLPMLWRRQQAAGFPSYAQGRFDEAAGATAAPSFYLAVNGRSCVYRYTGLDIAAEPRSEYRVVAAVRTDRLAGARAFISAYYRDADGRQLPGTELRSPLVKHNDVEAWDTIDIHMPMPGSEAHTIGLAVWVVQEELWNPDRPAHYIARQDIHGGAWFDDIAVYRLPTIDLTSTAADRGHVFDPDEEPAVVLRFGDGSEDDVRAHLTVRRASGAVLQRRDVVANDVQTTQRIGLGDVEPGVYEVDLQIQHNGTDLGRRVLQLVKLASGPPPAARFRHRLGIIVEPHAAIDWGVVSRLIERLGCHQIKVALPALGQEISEEQATALSGFLQDRLNQGAGIAGMLLTADDRAADGTGHGSVVDFVGRDPAGWTTSLKHLVARFQGEVGHWQVGADGDPRILRDERLSETMALLRQAMAEVTTAPRLILPWSAHRQLPADIDPQVLMLHIPCDILPQEIPNYVSAEFGETPIPIWLSLQVQSRPRYERLAALADFAKRIIFALQSPVDRVYLNQPWSSDKLFGAEAEEMFAVFRTLVAWFDDANYVGRLEMPEGVVCHVFDRNGQALLAMWDDLAPASGQDHILQLSGAMHMTDLWSKTVALRPEGPRHHVKLSAVPVIVHAAETWLVRFRQGMRFDPPLLPSESTVHEINLVVRNPRREPISGQLKLRPPRGWRVRPTALTFALQPGEEEPLPVLMQSAAREPAGRKHIAVEVAVEASRVFQFQTDLPLELDLADMEVWAELVMDGANLVVRHGVTNLSQDTVTFRSLADAPARKRQNLNIIGLRPGQSAVKMHVFTNAAALSGQTIRLGLKQIKGPRVHDLSIEVP